MVGAGLGVKDSVASERASDRAADGTADLVDQAWQESGHALGSRQLGRPDQALPRGVLGSGGPNGQSVPGALGGCGHYCLYTKANDVLTLQASYMGNLAGRLIEAGGRARGQGSSGDSSEQSGATQVLRRNLGPFCRSLRPKVVISDSWGEDQDRCLGEYLEAVARSLEMIRGALIKNYERMGELADGGAPVVASGRAVSPPSNAARILKDRSILNKPVIYPDFPFLPSFEAIDPVVKKLGQLARRALNQRKAAVGAHAQAGEDDDLARWWENFPRCPARDEFVEIRLEERYPTHPTGELLPRIVTDSQGKPRVDEAKYRAAVRECGGRRQDHFREFPLEFLAEDDRGANPEAKQAFREAQQELVGAIEKKVGQRGSGVMVDHVTLLGQQTGAGPSSAGGAGRASASAAQGAAVGAEFQSQIDEFRKAAKQLKRGNSS